MPDEIKDTLLSALDEYETEFEAKRDEFDDYSDEEVSDFHRKLASARAYVEGGW